MLYSEIIAVCSQIHTKLINTLCGQNVDCRTYRAVNTIRLSYKNQPVNAVQWNNCCLFCVPHKTHKYTVWAERRNVNVKLAVRIVTTVLYIQWPLGCTYSDHWAVLIVTTGLNIQRPLGCTYCDHWAVLIVTTGLYIQWPLGCTYSDHWAVHIMTTGLWRN
jgi:hypothetical protein